MANANIEEWTPQQVAEWLTGLGPTVEQYVELLEKRGLDGRRLLQLRCDDLEYLGVHIIGHQELILEAVEQLRNFQYEVRRECVLRLALAASAAARSLAAAHSPLERRLQTAALADVARLVHEVKPLVCWLDRWALLPGSVLGEKRAILLKLSLELATIAQRDRFAEQPARAVAAAAAGIANTADYILQDVSDHMVLVPATLDTVTLVQGTRPLGFCVVSSVCGHRQLADIRFGSPAHCAGTLHEGDEIVQVRGRVVVGWSGAAVLRACGAAAAACGTLQLTVRRRRAPPAASPPRRRVATPVLQTGMRPWHYQDLGAFKRELGLLPPVSAAAAAADAAPLASDADVDGAASSSDESEPLSPPASPEHIGSSTRMYPVRVRAAVARRHSVCGGSPRAHRPRPDREMHQFFQELRNERWITHSGSAQMETEDSEESALYRRDKALSCSTGLEISPRPKTCLGVTMNHPKLNKLKAQHATLLTSDEQQEAPERHRGKLDKAHSTPAYDFVDTTEQPGSLVTQIIPESPTTPTDSPTILVHSAEKADQILDFKKSSSQIGVAILHKQNKKGVEESKFPFNEDEDYESKVDEVLETVNKAMMEHQSERRHSAHKPLVIAETAPMTKSFTINEHVRLQNELVQAINEPRTNSRLRPATPPEPPPRPIASQKPYTDPPKPTKDIRMKEYPVLKPVKQPDTPEPLHSPLKPHKHGDILQISYPLKYITKHDIQMIPNERRELPALNSVEANLNLSQTDISKAGKKESAGEPSPGLSQSQSLQRLETCAAVASPAKSATLSPTASVVRGMFPSSKSKSLKKKNSILAKGRNVPAAAATLWAVLCGPAWRRSRRAHGWLPRHLLLLEHALLMYRDKQSSRADCLVHLEGFTVSTAPEVKSMQFAFKVYHTGSVFYLAVSSQDLMHTWIQQIHRATLLPGNKTSSITKQVSETECSDDDSDESPEKKDKDKDKEKEKDKSKFGSLKKLTHRMQRSESSESVHSTSLDRKYLRFFSRNKHKEGKEDGKSGKSKPTPIPTPTEHYRIYRRVPPAELSLSPPTPEPLPVPLAPAAADPARQSKKIPKPINYIHASNPNLLDFEKSDFVAKPNLQVPLPKPKVIRLDNFNVTLEAFMLKKQEEERQQVYTNRVLMGIERDKKEDRAASASASKKAAKELQKQWNKIVPDVIYGELPTYTDDQLPVPVVEQIQSRSLPKTPDRSKERRETPERADNKPQDGSMIPVSVKGKDGYEKIVYTSDKSPLKDMEIGEPPKILPRKPVTRNSPDIARKCSLTTAKDLGYEVIYGDDAPPPRTEADTLTSRPLTRNISNTSSKDLGYETIYGDNTDASKIYDRRYSEEKPPRIMPKSARVLNRQSSLSCRVTSAGSSAGGRARGGGAGGPAGGEAGGSGVDTSPVFLQGDSPEKFWLNSLRRNDKVHTGTAAVPGKLLHAAQYTPVTLPPPQSSALQPLATYGRQSPPPPASGLSRLRAAFSGASPRRARRPSPAPAPAPHPTPDAPPASEPPAPPARTPPAYYPHLQCPPTFEPETYCLAAAAPRLPRRDT